MKKILFLIYSISKKGGTERVATILANELAQKGHILTIACFDEKIKPSYELDNRVKTISIREKNIFSKSISIRTIIDNENPDLVICHNMGKLSLLLACIRKKSKTKFYSLEHVSYTSSPLAVKLAKRLLYKNYDAVVTLTNRDKEYYKHLHQKILVIPNFCPFENISHSYNEKSRQIISIGRLTHQKGFDLLLKAWEKIENKIPEWRLKIIGDGPEKENLINLIKKYNLKNLEILPNQDNIKAFYENSSFYIMSSRYEGLPMVLIEAQSFSLPIVSFNCPHGPAEIITDGVNGFLVASFNIEKLSEKILEMTQIERMQFSIEAFKKSEEFKKEKILKKWIDLIEAP